MPLAEHDVYRTVLALKSGVSIHVPLAEHDTSPGRKIHRPDDVSIHVPLAEHDPEADRSGS